MSRPATSTYTKPASPPFSSWIEGGAVESVRSASCASGICPPSMVDTRTRLRLSRSLRASPRRREAARICAGAPPPPPARGGVSAPADRRLDDALHAPDGHAIAADRAPVHGDVEVVPAGRALREGAPRPRDGRERLL